jgi:tetratricopeptide (TPR) repeat protein
MYKAIRAALTANTVREEYEGMAEALAPGLFSQADNNSMDAFEKWDAGDYNGAKDSAETALAMYLSGAAAAERQRALDLRANVAAKKEFDSAEEIFPQANADFSEHRYAEAAKLFEDSWLLFRESAQITLNRRQAAEEALRRANQRVAESDELAKNAELIVEGGLE